MSVLRVATYNIHKCCGLDRRVLPSRIADVLLERPHRTSSSSLRIRQSGIMQRRDGMSLQAFDSLRFPRNQRRKGKAP